MNVRFLYVRNKQNLNYIKRHLKLLQNIKYCKNESKDRKGLYSYNEKSYRQAYVKKVWRGEAWHPGSQFWLTARDLREDRREELTGFVELYSKFSLSATCFELLLHELMLNSLLPPCPQEKRSWLSPSVPSETPTCTWLKVPLLDWRVKPTWKAIIWIGNETVN